MPTNQVAIQSPKVGSGYQMLSGKFANVDALVMLGQQTFAAGVTVGPVFETGGRGMARLRCKVTAQAGTNPTLDVTIQTSPDGINAWRTVDVFVQKTAAGNSSAGLVMGAVTPAGTSPPTITLTSTAQAQPVDLRIECTTGGALATSVIRYSVDGGKTWVSNVTTAATVAVIDANGTDTGVVINIAAGTASTDNVWTAKTISYESKCFAGLDRYARAVALIGGSATPTMDASVQGELV